MDEQRSIPDGGSDGVFLFATSSRLALGPSQPAIQLEQGAFIPGIKRPRR